MDGFKLPSLTFSRSTGAFFASLPFPCPVSFSTASQKKNVEVVPSVLLYTSMYCTTLLVVHIICKKLVKARKTVKNGSCNSAIKSSVSALAPPNALHFYIQCDVRNICWPPRTSSPDSSSSSKKENIMLPFFWSPRSFQMTTLDPNGPS